MFKARVSASERTDVAGEIAKLVQRARSKNLRPDQVDLMTQQIDEALSVLVERGKALAANRSQMIVDRQVSGPGFRVDIHFQTGGRGEGLMAKLLRVLGM